MRGATTPSLTKVPSVRNTWMRLFTRWDLQLPASVFEFYTTAGVRLQSDSPTIEALRVVSYFAIPASRSRRSASSVAMAAFLSPSTPAYSKSSVPAGVRLCVTPSVHGFV